MNKSLVSAIDRLSTSVDNLTKSISPPTLTSATITNKKGTPQMAFTLNVGETKTQTIEFTFSDGSVSATPPVGTSTAWASDNPGIFTTAPANDGLSTASTGVAAGSANLTLVVADPAGADVPVSNTPDPVTVNAPAPTLTGASIVDA